MGIISNSYIDFYIKELAKDMGPVIDNLISHHLVEESERDDFSKELARATVQDQIDNLYRSQLSEMTGIEQKPTHKPVLEALLYIECIRNVGKNELNPVFVYNRQRRSKTNRKLNASTRNELCRYLEQINTAGLISAINNTECSTGIKKGKYKDKFDILFHLCSFVNLSQIPGYDSMIADKRKKSIANNDLEKALAEWKKVGILDHLTEKQLSSAAKKSFANDNESLNDALIHFQGVVYTFDLELGNLKDPYAELLKKLSRISHSAFSPTNIFDNFSKPVNSKVTLRFDLNNKTYLKELNIFNDWMDTDVFDFINKVVTENKLPGQFYSLYEGGQGASFIFLNPSQYKYLRENNLLVFNDF